MEVGFKLLEKYHLGLCTEEEKVEIDRWMHSEDLSYIPRSFYASEKEKNAIKEELWNNIITDKKKTHRLYYSHFIWYAAAVCVLFVLIYSGYSKLKNSPVESMAFSGSKSIMFSQSMEFKAQSDRTLTFFNSMDGVSDPCSATIQAEKGETYWVSNINFRGKEQVFVVNIKDVNELPAEIRVELIRSLKG